MKLLHSGEHMRRIGALDASFFEIALFTQLCHQQREETVLGVMLDLPLTRIRSAR
jgi:hypothetical protein